MVNQVNSTEDTSTPAFIPADEFVISDLETLKVLADPLRLSIVHYLRKPGTVKQIAERVNKPPTKLYYHFNLLEKHNLIQMVDTRLVSGIVEKQYQAAAHTFRLERGLLAPDSAGFDENLDVTLSHLFGAARDDLRQSMLAGVIKMAEDAPQHLRLLLTHGQVMLHPEQATSFYERLLALLREFNMSNDGEETDEMQAYKLVVLMHPLAHRPDDGE
ncbi:MAG: hypothetical protein OHK0046_14760 [Anaerolineae bacterium]